jgi:hypothetical protein
MPAAPLGRAAPVGPRRRRRRPRRRPRGLGPLAAQVRHRGLQPGAVRRQAQALRQCRARIRKALHQHARLALLARGRQL